MRRYAAVDLGASSGRVVVAEVGPGTLNLHEVHRFANVPVRAGGTLHWDILRIYRGVLDGLRAAGPVDGIGVDSWAVDYGLLDERGALLGNPVHYRDGRTEKVSSRVPFEELYARTGIARQPFNTIHQLAAEPRLGSATTMLLIPDLIAYWLTGEIGAELTNASTTQLLDARTREWDAVLAGGFGPASKILPPLRRPGEVIGPLTAEAADETGLPPGTPVIAVGSHDTASAVAAVPADGERFAYISCGTWSLVGVELDQPMISEEGRRANFTNEAGIDGTVRYLRNVTGLWLLQECVRVWETGGERVDLEALLGQAAGEAPFRSTVDADDPVFHAPGDMPGRLADFCRRTGQPVPETRARIVRCVVDSLALAHRAALQDAQRLTGQEVDVIHIVGGGSRNALLCELTADACGLPVVAGPVEATSIGNVLVQARADGAISGTLADLRALIRGTQRLERYEPRADAAVPAARAFARPAR
ncbi:rhamnulokinase family protein [Streptosporangium sp. 'caverna']|uniref:rhamnulokinase n=1 Tax=Streptosporangium sp. 'caverna' TaxID=2202249 RepID=UPI000D7DE723|nr:rhamnulokinase family protein [Streptosporangium sp. 'caverna']AWS41971.1 rhamnulokinase [Streptosporangium sp. 'caverna']